MNKNKNIYFYLYFSSGHLVGLKRNSLICLIILYFVVDEFNVTVKMVSMFVFNLIYGWCTNYLYPTAGLKVKQENCKNKAFFAIYSKFWLTGFSYFYGWFYISEDTNLLNSKSSRSIWAIDLKWKIVNIETQGRGVKCKRNKKSLHFTHLNPLYFNANIWKQIDFTTPSLYLGPLFILGFCQLDLQCMDYISQSL